MRHDAIDLDASCYSAYIAFGAPVRREEQELALEPEPTAQAAPLALVPEVAPSTPLHLCFLDTETTGLSPKTARIIDFYACSISPEGEAHELYLRVNPEEPIKNSFVHGIQDRHVQGKPPFAAFAARVLSFLQGKTLVAHNGDRYDVPLLQAELGRVGLTFTPAATVDTLALAKSVWEKPHSLGTLAARHGIETPRAHSARGDVETLLALWPHLIKSLAQRRGKCP